jgi:hypothetical protein
VVDPPRERQRSQRVRTFKLRTRLSSILLDFCSPSLRYLLSPVPYTYFGKSQVCLWLFSSPIDKRQYRPSDVPATTVLFRISPVIYH